MTQDGEVSSRMKRKAYEKELRKLQAQLCHLQGWVKEKKLRVIVLFEGRDAAGKGGAIKAITEKVSPRIFRVVALPAPSDREKSQMFVQRYMQHFPARGGIVIFDRNSAPASNMSWAFVRLTSTGVSCRCARKSRSISSTPASS